MTVGTFFLFLFLCTDGSFSAIGLNFRWVSVSNVIFCKGFSGQWVWIGTSAEYMKRLDKEKARMAAEIEEYERKRKNPTI